MISFGAFAEWLKCVCKGPARSLNIYWYAYGGKKALLNSPYVYLAFLIALVIRCSDAVTGANWDWSGKTLDVLPDLLGFTLGGYAILVGFGDKEFLNVLRGGGGNGTSSPYMQVNGAFVHFILAQVIALLAALITNALNIQNSFLVNLVGSFLLIYALLTVVAATLAIIFLADCYDKMPKK